MASAALLVGCQKDTSLEAGTQADVTPRVKAFVERALSAEQTKDNTPISLDSAEWYIEAGLNYWESQVSLEYNNQAVDSLETTIATEDGAVAAFDAYSAFQDLHAGLSEKITPGTNHLVLADVAFAASGEPALLRVKTLLIIGSGYEKNVHTSYGQNDFWHYGSNPVQNNNCGCGPNAGAAGQCADVRIQNRIRLAIGLPADGCFWHSVVTRGVNWGGLTGIAEINYPLTQFTTGIPATPYMLYRCAGASCENCLTPSMMSFYTQKAWDLMLMLKPTGKHPSTAQIDDITWMGFPPRYEHMALYSYGNLQCPPR